MKGRDRHISVDSGNRTRGNVFKLKGQFRSEMRKKRRVVKHWNRLLTGTVDAAFLEVLNV